MSDVIKSIGRLILPVLIACTGITACDGKTGNGDCPEMTASPPVRPWFSELDSVTLLRIDKIYLHNQLEMADDPSMDLSIDLRDREVLLQIEGIPLHRAFIDSFSASFTHDGPEELQDWLNGPFAIISYTATIPHQPVQVRNVPETYEELQALSNIPDPEADVPIRCLLSFDRGFDVYLDETSQPDSVLGQKIPLDRGGSRLRIKLHGKDIRAIYRAISDSSRMALRI